MEFTLHYRGDLKANRGPKDKQLLRRHFHAQLAILWKQVPLNERRKLLEKRPAKGHVSIIQAVNGFDFAPLINEQLNLIAELKITLLRPESPGSIITQAGDIDNRLKTLFDALKVPKEASAIPSDDKPQEGEDPFFCLLEDDNLITKVSVETDRLLYPCESSSEVEMLIHVTTKATRSTWANIGLG
ncbi:MAG: hypothetical protein HYY21_04230 [Candidatus Tectomicrobia bacterium]|nr:hypothetical protein [Candidatus Tectomicrobia bacterium]